MKLPVASLLVLLASAAEAAVEEEEIRTRQVETPDVFAQADEVLHCEENAVVHSWCDSAQFEELKCGILPDFDEYGCTCMGKTSLCPEECIGGTEPVERTHFGIRCKGIPQDSPNYILKERHPLKRCENNLVVSSWCDDYVNPHLECGLYEEDDQYICKCSGKATNCPDECIGGGEPIVKTPHSVLCSGIPVDSPNYIIKEA
jgi:hypothetical protein